MENPEAQALGFRDRRPGALGNLHVLPDEIICSLLECLTPLDIGRLSCVSSVMYILCNEEPLWMIMCLKNVTGHLQYKGSWKKTTLLYLYRERLSDEFEESCSRPLFFDGFNSLFLYRRFYRCNTTLGEYSFDDGNVARKKDLSLEEFSDQYDGQKPVLIAGLADTWPAMNKWSIDQFLLNYGDTAFRISQKSSGKIKMKIKDYVSYMKLQHDEDPLYIFDDKFGETVPGLLKDYNVPHLFQEDFFDVLDRDQRPPFRWLIIGPERSGASWHIDPALTSAWNTLLCGRKRWALYPPGKVPLGVTVHINEEDGDVNIETPSSLQWWLDFYPLLADEDKPIECTQLPGETIYVPSGWWHCVLNLETTLAVTQNFVNSKNLEFVCLDMAPGYRHKGICRVGFLVLDEESSGDAENCMLDNEDVLSNSDLMRKEKRIKIHSSGDDSDLKKTTNRNARSYDLWKQGFSYDINFLSKFLDEERDHYNFPWSSGNCMGQREMREWLAKLWAQKPGIRELTWKGACIAINANKWLERLAEICAFHNLHPPTDDERLPVGSGSNPVYLMGDYVTKIFIEEGLETSIHGLGAELELYSLLHQVNSPLKNHIPDVVASGILYFENGAYSIVPWDGKGVPDVITQCNLIPKKIVEDGFTFGVWSKKMFEYKIAGMSEKSLTNSAECTWIWPYIITKRCRGKMFAQIRDEVSWQDALNLASFLGEQLRNLHLLPHPPIHHQTFPDIEQERKVSSANGSRDVVPDTSNIPAEWELLVRTLAQKKKDVSSRLTKWGDPIPSKLIEKVNDYIPHDFEKFLCAYEGDDGINKVDKPCCWIHSDIMDDNIFMEQHSINPCTTESSVDTELVDGSAANGHDSTGEGKSWNPTYILDFSNLSIGDPLCDIIPLHLDVFRGDSSLLKQFLGSYKLPLSRRTLHPDSVEGGNKFEQLSYHAMCYCILHDDNVLGAIFSIWEDLRKATSWEEVEHKVWGELNNYKGFC